MHQGWEIDAGKADSGHQSWSQHDDRFVRAPESGIYPMNPRNGEVLQETSLYFTNLLASVIV